jgi:uncharacterized protein
MRKFALFFLVVLFCWPATAQQSIAEAAVLARNNRQSAVELATRDEVLTLLETLQVRKTMGVMLESMKQIMRDATEKSFRERVPNATPKQLAALDGMVDDIVGAQLDDLINAIIPIYQRHLTKTDIEEMIRFYSSPVGQKLLREQPQIIQESMQAGAAVQQKRMDEMNAKIQERLQEMEGGQEQTAAPQKQ